MVQETGISGDSIDELIRRLLFVKKTGKSDPTTTEDKIARRIWWTLKIFLERMVSTGKNLFYNEGSQAFINPWSYSKDNLTKTQFPKIYVRDDGSPYITRKNENPELTSPRAKAPGGGSFLTDWIQLYDASSLAPEFTDFKKIDQMQRM